MTLEFTSAAISDLHSIRAYTLEKWGPDQEQFYLDSLWTKFSHIQQNPALYRHRNDLFPQCQIAAHGSHLIMFRLQGTLLQVVRILHASIDLPRHIPKTFSQQQRSFSDL